MTEYNEPRIVIIAREIGLGLKPEQSMLAPLTPAELINWIGIEKWHEQHLAMGHEMDLPFEFT